MLLLSSFSVSNRYILSQILVAFSLSDMLTVHHNENIGFFTQHSCCLIHENCFRTFLKMWKVHFPFSKFESNCKVYEETKSIFFITWSLYKTYFKTQFRCDFEFSTLCNLVLIGRANFSWIKTALFFWLNKKKYHQKIIFNK